MQAETEASVYHTSKLISTGGIELQTVGKDYLWVGRTETRAKTFGMNKTTLGINAARLVDDGVIPRKVCFPVKCENVKHTSACPA